MAQLEARLRSAQRTARSRGAAMHPCAGRRVAVSPAAFTPHHSLLLTHASARGSTGGPGPAPSFARGATTIPNSTSPTSTAPSSPSPQPAPSLSLWTGADDFTPLGDRVDAPPLPLPPLAAAAAAAVRVVIVRHGQSTWNAEGRIQGSSDLSVLTDKGVRQAERSRDMLASLPFDAVFHSPLARARQTADVILQGRPGGPSAPRRTTLPSLREVDLYSFQGLVKAEGKARYGSEYGRWQRAPHEFTLDGHAPVRELWHRASLAWRSLLTAAGVTAAPAGEPPGAAAAAAAQPPAPQQPPPQPPQPQRSILVVAHNATNQALVATALRLPPRFFRRLPQNNAAVSMFDLRPAPQPEGSSGPPAGPAVTLRCLNQSSESPFKGEDKVVARVALLTLPTASATAATTTTTQQQLEQLERLAGVLAKLRVDTVLAAPSVQPDALTALLSTQAAAAGGGSAVVRLDAAAAADGAAAWARAVAAAANGPSSGGQHAAQSQQAQPHPQQQPPPPSYGNVLMVLDAAAHAAAVWAALGVGLAEAGGPAEAEAAAAAAASPAEGGLAAAAAAPPPRIAVSPGGLSVIEFPADPAATPAVIRCINSTAHMLGPAAAAQ